MFLGILLTIVPACRAADKPPTESKTYLRVDFELKGSQCPACIRRLVKKIRASKGIARADISIRKPYSGVVVFDKKVTSFEAIKKKLRSEKTEADNIEEEELKSVPELLIPKSLMTRLEKNKH
ncbi:hypothetical protein GC174_07065 [bacterium]|nr:hypothetical protein [bacterium]